MATQSYVIAREQEIISFRDSIAETFVALQGDIERGTFGANRDCWGTLAVNLRILQLQIDGLKQKLGEQLDATAG